MTTDDSDLRTLSNIYIYKSKLTKFTNQRHQHVLCDQLFYSDINLFDIVR